MNGKVFKEDWHCLSANTLLDSVAVITMRSLLHNAWCREKCHYFKCSSKLWTKAVGKQFRIPTRKFLLIVQRLIPQLKRSTFISPVQYFNYNKKIIFNEYFPCTRHILFYFILPAWWSRFCYYNLRFTDMTTETYREIIQWFSTISWQSQASPTGTLDFRVPTLILTWGGLFRHTGLFCILSTMSQG